MPTTLLFVLTAALLACGASASAARSYSAQANARKTRFLSDRIDDWKRAAG